MAAASPAMADRPACLLDPHREVVAFTGRTEAIDALLVWCHDAGGDRLRLVTGPGGVGKTRLAVQLGRRLAMLGWSVHWLSGDREADLTALPVGPASLLVVDDAEQRTGLGRLLAALGDGPAAGCRVLLLARSRGAWWLRLRADETVRALMSAIQPECLDLAPALAPGRPATETVTSAFRAFAAAVGMAQPVEDLGEVAEPPSRVLDLHAAALMAAVGTEEGPTSRSGPVSVGTALDDLLRREQRWWLRAAAAHGMASVDDRELPQPLRQLIAAACLLGAATEEEAIALADRVPGLQASAECAAWLRELCPVLRDEPWWLGPLRPARMADLLVTRELAASPEFATACMEGLDVGRVAGVVRLLVRACTEDRRVIGQLAEVLRTAEALVDDLQAPLEELTTVADALSVAASRLVMPEPAIRLYARVAEMLPETTAQAVKAYWMGGTAARLAGIGRPAQVVQWFEQTAALRRRVAVSGSALQRSNLAGSLGNLSLAYQSAGRKDDALRAAVEGVEIRRELATSDPEAFRRSLGPALDMLAGAYAGTGRQAEAAQAGAEAISILREPGNGDRTERLARLAIALRRLATRCQQAGREDDAVTAITESVSICRSLVADRAEASVIDLKNALDGLAALYTAQRKADAAVDAAREAVDILRDMAGADSGGRKLALALALSDLSIRYANLERPADAARFCEESIAIRRNLPASGSDANRNGLAFLLGFLGRWYAIMGRHADAIQVLEEAIAVFRDLPVEGTPVDQRPGLARALGDLGRCYAQLGRTADSLTATEEAVAIHRDLVSASPAERESALRDVLLERAAVLLTAERRMEYLQAVDEASRIAQRLRIQRHQTAGPSPGP